MIEEFLVVSTGMTVSLDPEKSPDLHARLKAHPMEYKPVVDGKTPSDTVTRKTAAKGHDEIGD